MPQTITFRLTAKRGQQELFRVTGPTLYTDNITVGELQQVIPTEQFLEKLFGLRFHIESETAEVVLANQTVVSMPPRK